MSRRVKPFILWLPNFIGMLKRQRLPQTQSGSQKGFTLLEVMVALAILAVASLAVHQASKGYMSRVERVKTQTLAQFVLFNTVEDLKMRPLQPNKMDDQDLSVSEQGADWRVTIKTAPTSQVINLAQKLEVKVYSKEKGVSSTNSLASTELWIKQQI